MQLRLGGQSQLICLLLTTHYSLLATYYVLLNLLLPLTTYYGRASVGSPSSSCSSMSHSTRILRIEALISSWRQM